MSDSSAHSAVVFSRQFVAFCSVAFCNRVLSRSVSKWPPKRAAKFTHERPLSSRPTAALSLAQGERAIICHDGAHRGKDARGKRAISSRLANDRNHVRLPRRFLPMALPNFFLSDISQVFSPPPPRKHFISATHLSSPSFTASADRRTAHVQEWKIKTCACEKLEGVNGEGDPKAGH